MTLNKAIEVLDNILSRLSLVEEPDDLASINLAREALKRVAAQRHFFYTPIISFLPGETVE